MITRVSEYRIDYGARRTSTWMENVAELIP
ncbi:hypothetical protein FHW77_005393 [Agrobacterium sp. RC10-4-1]|nr:hypothetical protein [Agrobacterium sp. RC10-4-1]